MPRQKPDGENPHENGELGPNKDMLISYRLRGSETFVLHKSSGLTYSPVVEEVPIGINNIRFAQFKLHESHYRLHIFFPCILSIGDRHIDINVGE